VDAEVGRHFAAVMDLARQKLVQVERILREKFGRQFKAHLHEKIPHRHGQGKSSVEATEEYSAQSFLELVGEMLA